MNIDLEMLVRFFGRCTIFGLLIIAIWFVVYLAGGVCGLQAPLFNLNPHECELLSFGGLALAKVLVLTFFFFPWVSLKLELRRRSRQLP